MDKQKAQEFAGALQRLMERYKLCEITTTDGRVVFHDENGRPCFSFESMDLAHVSLSDCFVDVAWTGGR